MEKATADIVLISENRRARHDYEILDTLECGMVLVGSEVKMLRLKRVNFSDSYALLKNGELFLLGLRIDPYDRAAYFGHEAERTRKLLANRKELRKLGKETREKGSTLIPLKLYFKKGRAKVLIGIAKGKSNFDKRHDVKKREADRAVARVMRRG